MRRYWLQNNQNGFETILQKFIICLTKRGYQLEDIIPILQRTAAQLNNTYLQQSSQSNRNTLYIHQTFHPHGIERTGIRTLFNKTLEPILDFNRMTVTISRPRNLKDILTKASLMMPPHLDVQQTINELKE